MALRYVLQTGASQLGASLVLGGRWASCRTRPRSAASRNSGLAITANIEIENTIATPVATMIIDGTPWGCTWDRVLTVLTSVISDPFLPSL